MYGLYEFSVMRSIFWHFVPRIIAKYFPVVMSYQSIISARFRAFFAVVALVSAMSVNLYQGSAQDLQNLQPTHGRLSYVSVEGVRTLSQGEWPSPPL